MRTIVGNNLIKWTITMGYIIFDRMHSHITDSRTHATEWSNVNLSVPATFWTFDLCLFSPISTKCGFAANSLTETLPLGGWGSFDLSQSSETHSRRNLHVQIRYDQLSKHPCNLTRSGKFIEKGWKCSTLTRYIQWGVYFHVLSLPGLFLPR